MADLECRTCSRCGYINPPETRQCGCGFLLTPGPEAPPAREASPKPKAKLWLAMLPGLIAAVTSVGLMTRHTQEFSKVSKALALEAGPPPSPDADPRNCVETYGITLSTSEYYVREWPLVQPRNAPRELSTVLRGMARNTCAEPLNNVKISLKVSDDAGKRGSGEAVVGRLGAGEVKQFERAWMGRVTSYEITRIR